MRASFPFVVLVLISSCSQDEVRLIKRYELVWEANLLERYAHSETQLSVIPFFRFIFINPDGSLYVIHLPPGHTEVTTITLLNAEGEFLNNVTLSNTYVLGVSANQLGFMQTLARSGDDYLIMTWDENLNKTITKVLPQPSYFHNYFLRGNFYYEIRFNTEAGSFLLTKFNFNDEVQWTWRFRDYGINGFTAPMFFPGGEDIALSRSNHDFDSLHVVKLRGSSGGVVWHKKYSFADLGADNYIPAVIPLADGRVVIFSNFRYRVMTNHGLMVSSGRLGNTQSIPESFVTHCISQDDRGYLLATTFAHEEGWHGFRLIKTDSRFNAGWLGNFHQSVPGYLSHVVSRGKLSYWLTSNGYLYAIRPAE